MSTPLNQSQAKTWTLGAQIGAFVCVLAAVGVGIKGLPEHTPGAALEQAKASAWPVNMPGSDTSKGNATDKALLDDRGVDTLGLAERLSLLDNAPESMRTVDTPEVDVTIDDPVPEEGPGDITIIRRVRYVGFINDARTQHAFIRIDGKQRIVAAGGIAKSGDEQFPDLKVERVTPQLIILSDGETRAAVNIADHSGPSVTMVSGDDIAVAAVPEDSTKLTPEEEAMIASLPPRQRQMAQRRLEREKRGLPPENENRRPTPEPLVSTRGTFNQNSERPNVQRRNNPRDE